MIEHPTKALDVQSFTEEPYEIQDPRRGYFFM
jgi:hypothetical protein